MAHGRSPSRAIPVHAILSVEQTKKAPRRQKPGSTAFELRARAQARHALLTRRRAWPFGLVFAVRCVGLAPPPISSREAGAAKRVPKRNIALLFSTNNSTVLVYRPEHGRTTRRT